MSFYRQRMALARLFALALNRSTMAVDKSVGGSPGKCIKTALELDREQGDENLSTSYAIDFPGFVWNQSDGMIMHYCPRAYFLISCHRVDEICQSGSERVSVHVAQARNGTLFDPAVIRCATDR
ncbi:MAG: hypothetical protein ABSC06_04030 [Rhodopila sp.]|jgi:hypothetical protein